MVLLGILTVYINGITLLHFQEKIHYKVLCFIYSDTYESCHLRCWVESRAQLCALNQGLGLPFHTCLRAHVCVADLGACGSFVCVCI